MIPRTLTALLAAGLLASPLALAEESAGTTDLSMDEAMAQAQTEGGQPGGAQTQPQEQAGGGIEARRERLQIGGGGDSAVGAGTAFNPAISVILDGVYGAFSGDREDPPGFGGGHSHGHGHGGHSHGIDEGFQIREAEVTFEGAVDPYFDMLVTAAISDSDIELEEAYITTRALPAGLQIKAGKFLSDVGYINRQHVHDWDFVDQPWMREFIFGEEGLNETGVQASWVAPTRNFTRFGVEVLEGETAGVANNVGSERLDLTSVEENPDGTPNRIRFRDYNDLDDKAGPRLFTAFANYAPDIGYDHAVQFGVSGGFARSFQDQEFHSSGRLETWDGDAWFAGVDAVYKYNGQGVMGHGNLTLQGEYFIRERDLTYREFEFNENGDFQQTEHGNIRPRQDGMYVQGIYGFAPRWNAGARLDTVGLTNKAFDANGPDDASTSFRYTGQVSYSPTEFSRIRAQVSKSDLHREAGGHNHNHWEFLLQYNISLGEHGAHAF